MPRIFVQKDFSIRSILILFRVSSDDGSLGTCM